MINTLQGKRESSASETTTTTTTTMMPMPMPTKPTTNADETAVMSTSEGENVAATSGSAQQQQQQQQNNNISVNCKDEDLKADIPYFNDDIEDDDADGDGIGLGLGPDDDDNDDDDDDDGAEDDDDDDDGDGDDDGVDDDDRDMDAEEQLANLTTNVLSPSSTSTSAAAAAAATAASKRRPSERRLPMTAAHLATTTSTTTTTSSSSSSSLHNKSDALTLHDFATWCNESDNIVDDPYMEDNVSDYASSSYAASETNGDRSTNYYQAEKLTGAAGMEMGFSDINYTPANAASDMLLRPPSNTSYQYNYPAQATTPLSPRHMHMQAQAQAQPHLELTLAQSQQQFQQQQQHLALARIVGQGTAGMLPGMHGFAPSHAHHHQQQQQQQQQHLHQHQHAPHPHLLQQQQHQHGHGHGHGLGVYPNMWHPNAPYGTGGSSGSGSGAGGGGGGNSNNNSIATPTGSPGIYPFGPHPHRYSPYHTPYHHGGASIHPHSHDAMMEMFQLSNSGREARNRAEKNRRDKLNGSIQELSTMVPHVAESPRRVDKTAVLRFAAHGLRLKYVFGKANQQQQEQHNQQKPLITDTLMNMLDSFFLTLTCHGQILLISSSIEQHLGHCQADLYGQNILHITHPEDQNMLKQQLIPTDLENLFDVQTETDESGEPPQRTNAEEAYIDRKLREDRRSFRVRLARAGPRSEPTAYEVVKIDGCFRRSDEAPRGVKTSTFTSSLQLIRRTRGRDDAIPLHTISGNDIVLTARARIIRPPKIINRLIDANALEYKTRHLIDGRIIDCDQRIGIVAGYMTNEVRNLSPFTFMHNDDVRWVIVALRQMYDCNSSYGESTYRLFTRNGNIIYLQSKGYLEIDKETNKVHSFVCVNTLLDDEEGKRRVQEMKKKFSVIINTKIPQSTIDVPASENPQQLEKAVLCLIQNLQKQTPDDDEAPHDDAISGLDFMDHVANSSCLQQRHQQHYELAQQPYLYAQHQSQHRQHLDAMAGDRLAVTGAVAPKTPPLALVPPEAASVKSSISKSVSVVNVTAAKHLRGIQQLKSPTPATASSSSNNNNNSSNADTNKDSAPNRSVAALLESCTCQSQSDGECDFCQSPLTPETEAMLERNNITLDNTDIKLSKRRLKPTEIEHVLTSSLDQIGRTLNQQLNAAIELRDQGSRFEVPNSSQRIDEIMEEHQKQSELYVNIKSEYEVQIQNKTNTTKTEQELGELRPR